MIYSYQSTIRQWLLIAVTLICCIVAADAYIHIRNLNLQNKSLNMAYVHLRAS